MYGKWSGILYMGNAFVPQSEQQQGKYFYYNSPNIHADVLKYFKGNTDQLFFSVADS